MDISVVIPTYNEKGVLENCIESLGDQTYKDFEIIVVDDGSTDGTLEVLANLKKTIPDFKYIKESHVGAGSARNSGAKEAKGKILVFVDADMTFDGDFLEKLVEPIEKGQTKGTFSREEHVSNWNNVWARCWCINEGWEPKERHPKDYPSHQPVFRAILKSEFERAGGFTPGGYMDDWSLSGKLGYEAVNAPGAVFYHSNPESLDEIFKDAKWVAKRKYKFGVIGDFAALVRASLPVSLIIGIYKGLTNKEPRFLIFKIVYDLGVFIGVVEFMFTGKGGK